MIMLYMPIRDMVAIMKEASVEHQWIGHSPNYLQAHYHRIHRKYSENTRDLKYHRLEILVLKQYELEVF